jgi:hypothetical protein
VIFAQLENTVEATTDVKVFLMLVDFVLFGPLGAMVDCDDRTIKLSRSVVSVESDGELKLTGGACEHRTSRCIVSDIVVLEVCVSWSFLSAYY